MFMKFFGTSLDYKFLFYTLCQKQFNLLEGFKSRARLCFDRFWFRIFVTSGANCMTSIVIEDKEWKAIFVYFFRITTIE